MICQRPHNAAPRTSPLHPAMRQAIHNIMNTAPLFWHFCCFAVGAAGAACQLSGCLLLLIVVALQLCCWLGSGSAWRHCVTVVLISAGYSWAGLFLARPWQTYLNKMPRREGYVRLCLRLCKTPSLPPELQELSSGREKWHAEILAMRTYADSSWQPASGKVLLQSKKTLRTELQQLELGQKLIADGCLLLPPDENSAAGYYGKYLKIIGIERIFLLQELRRKMPAEKNLCWKFSIGLQNLRGTLARHLVAGVDNPDAARMLLALGLGMNEQLRSETNQRFIRSGTIHIFSISGLHVGMVLLLAENFLRGIGLTLRRRWFMLAPALFAYLMLTGTSPSILRAFNMSLLFLYAGWRFRPPSALNSLGFSGLLALIGNPLYVLHSGFLYSYLIVIVLILAWKPIQAGRAVLLEKKRWIPRKYQGWCFCENQLANLFAALASSSVAWLGSAGITLRINGLLCLLSPVVNIPLGASVFLILASCPIKLLLAYTWPASQKISGATIQVLLDSLQFWAETASESTLTWNAVPFNNLENFLYHLALALWLLRLTARFQEPQKKEPPSQTKSLIRRFNLPHC